MPGKSHFRFATYSWTPLDDDGVRAGAEFLNEFLFNVVNNVVNNEDFPTAARIQKNLDSGLLDKLLTGRSEPGVKWAHWAYDDVLGV